MQTLQEIKDNIMRKLENANSERQEASNLRVKIDNKIS